MLFFDPIYLLFALPAIVLALAAQLYVKYNFSKYSKIHASSGMSGAQAAYAMLVGAGVTNFRLERTSGILTDHYDPSSRTLRLSADVYDSTSLAAIGVACHEAGHALQHSDAYLWLGLRSALVPITNIGSTLYYWIFIAGLFFHSQPLVYIGIGMFGLVVLFTLVTLPVEWNASSRAKKLMVSSGIVTASEAGRAGAVLNAAFMTYLASAIQALATLLYYILRSRGRSR